MLVLSLARNVKHGSLRGRVRLNTSTSNLPGTARTPRRTRSPVTKGRHAAPGLLRDPDVAYP
jgi:hypothetical protein